MRPLFEALSKAMERPARVRTSVAHHLSEPSDVFALLLQQPANIEARRSAPPQEAKADDAGQEQDQAEQPAHEKQAESVVSVPPSIAALQLPPPQHAHAEFAARPHLPPAKLKAAAEPAHPRSTKTAPVENSAARAVAQPSLEVLSQLRQAAAAPAAPVMRQAVETAVPKPVVVPDEAEDEEPPPSDVAAEAKPRAAPREQQHPPVALRPPVREHATDPGGQATPTPKPSPSQRQAIQSPGPARLEPTTAGMATPPLAAPQPVARQVAAAVAAQLPASSRAAPVEPPVLSPTVRSLKVALQPRDLGQLRLTLRLAGDALDLTVEAETPQALRSLEQDKGLIGRLLLEAGVAADVTRIDMRLGSFTSPAPQSASAQQFAGAGPGNSSAQGSGRGNDGQSPPDSKAPEASPGPAAHDQIQDDAGRRPQRGIYL